MKKRRIKYKSKDPAKVLYHKYQIRYNRAQKKLAEQGYVMADPKYTKEEFMAMYEATKNDLEDEAKKTGKQPRKDIIGAMIDKQKFEISSKQAAAIRKNYRTLRELAEEYGYDVPTGYIPSQYEIRSGVAIDPEILRIRYHELRDDGFSASDAKKSISEEFFGS